MTWWNVLSTQEIKQDGAKTVNHTLWTNSTCRTEVQKQIKSHIPKIFHGTLLLCVTHLPVFRYSGGVKAKLVLQLFPSLLFFIRPKHDSLGLPSYKSQSRNKRITLLYRRPEKHLWQTSRDLPHQKRPCMHADHGRVLSLCYCSILMPVPHKAQPSSSLPSSGGSFPLKHIITSPS